MISPRLRRTGSYERRGKPNRVIDRRRERRLLAERAAAEAQQTAEARARLVTEHPTLLSDLGHLDRDAFSLFLSLLGETLSARRPGEREIRTTTGDGSLEIRLVPVPALARRWRFAPTQASSAECDHVLRRSSTLTTAAQRLSVA